MGLKIIANYFTLLFFWSAMTMLLLGSVPAFHFIPDEKSGDAVSSDSYRNRAKNFGLCKLSLIVAQEAVL